MTPAQLKSLRKQLDLSQRGLAELLRLSANGQRTVRRWEMGEIPIPGPVAIALQALAKGFKPD